MIRISLYPCSIALAGLTPRIAHAQGAAGASTIDPVLAAEARISLDSARTIALHKVKIGRVAAEEPEREHGKLMYSFDVKVPRQSGIEEVSVNALNGAVIGVHHESAATEAKEAREDSAAAKKAASAHATPPV